MGKAHHRASLLLIGHSLELLLKSELASKNVSEKRLRNEFGHDLNKMLTAVECADIKAALESHAEGWARDLERRGLSGDPSEDDPAKGQFWEMVHDLSDLHSSASGYALRYPHDPVNAPYPVWLYLVVQNCIWNRLENITGHTIVDDPLPIEFRA